MNPGELALLIPIVAIIAGTVVKLSRMKLESNNPAVGHDALARIEALEGELDGLRRELSETQERVDFTERLLAQAAEGRSLGPDRNPRP